MSTPHDKQPVSRERWALEGRVQALTECYERRLGRLPVWLHELDLERIVPLLECCIRIGMPLPIGDTLQADDAERRAQAQKSIRGPQSGA
jgi:hypothetical protein